MSWYVTRSRASAILVGSTLVLTGLVPAQSAPGDNYPSASDVKRAQQRANQATDQVGELDQALAATQASMEQAYTQAQAAQEAHADALNELAMRTKAAERAQLDANSAREKARSVQTHVARLGVEQYRERLNNPLANVLLSAPDDQAGWERVTTLSAVSGVRDSAYKQLAMANGAAHHAQDQADAAKVAQKIAADHAAAKRQEAEAAAQSAAQKVAAVSAERDALIVQVAALRQTSVELERQRQSGLALERERAAEAQAAAKRRPARPATRPGSSDVSAPAAPRPGSGGQQSGSSSAGQQAVNWAVDQVGKPYEWGADGPDSFDCSGLVMRAWQRAGVSLPHSSRAQYRQVKKIDYGSMRPGDLIFYGSADNVESIHHVTMYIGDGMMVEAPRTGLNVRTIAVRMRGTMPFAGRV